MIKTKSAGGIVLRDDKVLVVSQHGTSWSLPKGHIEAGEDEIQAAKREILEETGITNLKLIKKLGCYQRYKIDEYGNEDKSELKEIHMFLFETYQEILKPFDSENPEAKWVQKHEVIDILTHQKDREFYLNFLNKI